MDVHFHTVRRALLLAAPAAWLAGCASLGPPSSVTLTQRDIERLLERRFPLERRVTDLFDVTLKTPRVRLLAERNRLAAVLDVRARDRLLFGSWQGRLSFDTALRWEPRDQSVRLAQVRVEDLALDDPGSATRSTLERLGAALAERVLEDISLYELTADKARELTQAGVQPSGVAVTPRGVEITFSPLVKT